MKIFIKLHDGDGVFYVDPQFIVAVTARPEGEEGSALGFSVGGMAGLAGAEIKESPDEVVSLINQGLEVGGCN